jgi:hypothetical protein
MQAFRLVNDAYSPIEVGQILPSSGATASHLKIGAGIYLLPTEDDAENFLLSPHGYAYTHVLECEVADVSASDIDLDGGGNDFARFRAEFNAARPRPNGMDATHAQRLAGYSAFAQANGKKGLRWKSSGVPGWTEWVLHEPHCNATVTVARSTPVPEWRYQRRLPPVPPVAEIAEAAYFRWWNGLRIDGHDVDDWLRAEHDLWVR